MNLKTHRIIAGILVACLVIPLVVFPWVPAVLAILFMIGGIPGLVFIPIFNYALKGVSPELTKEQSWWLLIPNYVICSVAMSLYLTSGIFGLGTLAGSENTLTDSLLQVAVISIILQLLATYSCNVFFARVSFDTATWRRVIGRMFLFHATPTVFALLALIPSYPQ